MNRDEIKEIINDHVAASAYTAHEGRLHASIDGIDDAAEAIARLVESRIKHLTIALVGARKYVAKMKADGVETVLSPRAMLERIDEALDGVEQQPVDRVRAMAALVYRLNDNYFSVPDGLGSVCTAFSVDEDFVCRGTAELCRSDACDHIKAVEMYLAQKESAK